jgi:hypothetical protein
LVRSWRTHTTAPRPCDGLVALAGRGPAGVALLVKPASVEYIKQQTKRVEQMNAKLAREDTLLAKEEKAEEMRVVAVRKAHQLAQERARARKEKVQNAQLQLENAKLKEKLLRAKLQARRASIGEMQAKVKAGDYSLTGLPHIAGRRAAKSARATRAHRGKHAVAPPRGVRFVSKDPFAAGAQQAPLVRLAKLPAGQAYKKHAPQLAGDYVKACQKGERCHRVYRPETVEHWDKAKHTMVDMESGLPLPVGPARRVPITALTNPGRDTARPEPDHSIFGVYTGSFFGPSDKQFSDNFVPIQHTALGEEHTIAPWLASDTATTKEGGKADMAALPSVQGNASRPLFFFEFFFWQRRARKPTWLRCQACQVTLVGLFRHRHLRGLFCHMHRSLLPYA